MLSLGLGHSKLILDMCLWATSTWSFLQYLALLHHGSLNRLLLHGGVCDLFVTNISAVFSLPTLLSLPPPETSGPCCLCFSLWFPHSAAATCFSGGMYWEKGSMRNNIILMEPKWPTGSIEEKLLSTYAFWQTLDVTYYRVRWIDIQRHSNIGHVRLYKLSNCNILKVMCSNGMFTSVCGAVKWNDFLQSSWYSANLQIPPCLMPLLVCSYFRRTGEDLEKKMVHSHRQLPLLLWIYYSKSTL